MAKILNIAVLCPLARTFHYLAPEHLNLKILKPGIRVRVPFGSRKVVGIFLNIAENSLVPEAKLKPIDNIVDAEPLFSTGLLNFLKWISEYYHYPLGEVFATALPNSLKKGEKAQLLTDLEWRLTQKGSILELAELQNAPKQRKIIEVFKNRKKIQAFELKKLNITRESLNILTKKALIEPIDSIKLPELPAADAQPLSLNASQAAVAQKIISGLQAFEVFLLQGITGSGKTEVYFHVIEKVLAEQKQVLVLIPEIGLTPQTLNRFRQRFAVPIGVLHSGIAEKQRTHEWLLCGKNQLKILIGTRSALFAPLNHLGLIIIDEAHDTSFKQQEGLRYSARDCAVFYAKQLNIPVVLGSATPSLESYYNAQTHKYTLLKLNERAGAATLPKVKLLDLRRQTLHEGFAKETLTLMSRHLQQGGQILVFINRRGFAPSLICHQCGFVFECHRCDVKLTYYQHLNSLRCHHCDAQRKKPVQCESCGAKELVALGFGTERLESMLSKTFPNHTIMRIDRDNTRKKNSFNTMLAKIHAGDVDILVGTQMLAKGHHFPNVTLAVIVNADSGFLSADLKASERMGQLITQVAGRAGRATKKGEVIIQTRQPENPLFQPLIRHDYETFTKILLEQRRLTLMPPYSHIALFRAEARDYKVTYDFLNQIKQLLENSAKKLQLYGPVSAPIQRKAGLQRIQLLVQADKRHALQTALAEVMPKFSSLSHVNKVKWSLDVDSQDFA